MGRTSYKKESYSFDFIPASKPGNGQVAFRISNEKGPVPADDLSGKPVMIEFEITAGLAKKYNSYASSENPAAGQKGVYYRMPGTAGVKLIHEMNVISSARATIAQFGVVAPLPEEYLNGSFGLEFHAETGAIKSITRK